MADDEKKIVAISSRLAKFIGLKATREKKMQAAAMQAEFTLHDTLIILCYLSKDPDPEIAQQARQNLIPAARTWHTRPDRPELPGPILEIVTKVIEKIGAGKGQDELGEAEAAVTGYIGLLGLGEIIQSVDHNSRTVRIMLERGRESAMVFTENGKVVGAVCDGKDGLDALYHAFTWVDATFRYLHGPPGEFENRIKINTMMLVMDAIEHSPDVDPYATAESLSWSVHGHLKVMNLFEIAEIFEMNSKQAVCYLEREDQTGNLYFKSGRIINASLRDMTGMDAACHLLAWPNAVFQIQRGGEEIPEVIFAGMQNLIIEAMRLLDEGITVTDRIASELAVINELFDGRDLIMLPVMEKVRLVFSDEGAREQLEVDTNPLVRKAIKVKISKTVHKYLNPLTEHQQRMQAARGRVALSTTEKLVLLTYLSHDESQEIREEAKNTLASLDVPTYRKGFGADLHPSVIDFLVRETIRDETLLLMACACDNLLEETALYILENRGSPQVLQALFDNRKLLERSPNVVTRMAQQAAGDEGFLAKLAWVEESFLEGQTDIKVEGPLAMCGLAGLMRAAKQGNRSGTITLESKTQSGRLFFRRGKVVGAKWDHREGLPALEEMIKTPGLRFRYLLRSYLHTENLDPIAADDLLATTTAGPTTMDQDGSGIRLFSGSMLAMDIYESLTAVEGTPGTLCVTIACEEGTGEIYRDRSRILHVAVSGMDNPYKAMAAMLSWNGLRFFIRPAPAEFPVTVDKNLHDFFTESMKLLPEELTAAKKPGELPEWELSEEEYQSLYHRILQMGVAEKVKLAFLGNKEAREILVRDSNKLVAVAAVKSPKTQEAEIESISKSRQVSDDVLRHIASSKEWMKSYQVKLNLAGNPKTPVPIAMRILSQLRESELRKLAKDKNVSQTVATHARRLVDLKGVPGG